MKQAVTTLVFVIAVCGWGLHAQTNINMGSQTSVTGCDINIYDDGGSNGNYGSSHTYTLTIYPSANQGRILLEINSLDIHHNDTLFIYDGATAAGAPVAALNNNTYNANLNASTFMASQGNTTGAMTLRFKASWFLAILGGHGEGFAIHASCVAPCSPFQIALTPAQCSHVPMLHPDDGYYYIDVCPNETVHLAVHGIYPNQQTAGYAQNDASTTFSWDLEPSVTLSGAGMNEVTHTFPPGTGSEITVSATDTLHCPVTQPVTFRMRSSKSPVAHVPPSPPLCKGQTFTPQVGYTAGSDILLQEVGHSQHASLTVSDTVFLPDGAYCPPYGLYYRSNVTFTEFAPGATLTNANDILYVRIKMEHSAIEDLKIEIYCPNGSSATILPNPNYEIDYWGGTLQYYRINMGSAYRPDGGTCSPSLNPMGDPWNYVWSNNSTLGYQYAAANGSCFNTANFHSHYNPHWDDSNIQYFGNNTHSHSVDSSNVANMTQIYHPYQSFNSLVGCPLNGNWYIQVQDMLPEDNGYIVEWELALNPELMPSVWEYTIGIDTFFFTGDQVIGNTTLQPMATGDNYFGFTIVDDFGCQYDTTLRVTVYAPEVTLGDDILACPGTSVYLTPVQTHSSYQYSWNTGSTATGFYTSEPGTYSVTASVIANGSTTCTSSDTIEFQHYDVPDTTVFRDTICQGHDYEEHGFSMSAEFLNQLFNQHPDWPMSWFDGIQTIEDQHGCDSLVVVHLVVLRRWENEQTVLACEQYLWDGDTLTESGDYVKHFVSRHGCDSTVTLHLGIGHPSENEVEETSCGPFRWNNENFSESGDYERTLTSSYGCDSVVTLHLTVVDTTLRTSSSNPNFCHSEETTISVEGNFDTYQWSTGEMGNSIFVTQSGYYTVTANNYACERTATVLIPFCPPTLTLPNAFTPGNPDDINDYFSLSEHDRNQIVEFHIAIYNRWGELVFASDDRNFRWNGTANGKVIPNTVYTYVIRCTDHTGKPYRTSGSVTVL